MSCSALFNLNSGYLFQGVTPKQWLHTFPDIFRELLANNTTNFSRFHNIINNNDNFIELLVNNATYFFRVYIKQDWYFQRVPSKLNHEKNFQSSYHTILTLRELLQTILTYSELISNSTNNSKHFFESFNGYLKRHEILKQKFHKWKWE